MVNNVLFRLFWPSDAPRANTPGVLLGWKNSDSDVIVISILQDVDPKRVERALTAEHLYRNSPYPPEDILERCGKNEKNDLRVLGVVNPRIPPIKPFDPNSLIAFTSTKSKFPTLYCPDVGNYTLQMLLFDRPNPKTMQYFSLSPISLALGDKSATVSPSSLPFDKIELDEENERNRKRALVQKLRLHTVVRHRRTSKEAALPLIVDQINCSSELNDLLQSNIGLVGARSRRAQSVSERVVESATNLWYLVYLGLWHILTVWVYPVIAQVFVLCLMCHRVLAEVLLTVLDWRLFPNHAALKDISATAQQLDIRLQQFCYWPVQFVTLRKRNQTWQSITNTQPEYIRFYNSLWLVANDVIMGIALGTYIIDNADLVASQVDKVLDSWSINGLHQIILWLMDWPAGLKLNTELAKFLGDLFIWVIAYWAGCMEMVRPHLPELIRLIGFSAFAGATFPISLLSDMASVLTLHIYAFYVASARIYNWQVSILASLFQLFRGKKINVLRKRIDSCDYDLDQLLLGTILFTVLFFLLPTVFVFYLTFASARMAIISFKAGLDTLLSCLNHFPLFALMLRFKDSSRLPGGIHFELQTTSPTLPPIPIPQSSTTPNPLPTAPSSRIYLRSVALPFLTMFHEYFQLGNRIRKHYVSPTVIGCLVLGRFVPPIHRKNLYELQYSMLPAERVSISVLWELLVVQRNFSIGKPMGNGANGNGHGYVSLKLPPEAANLHRSRKMGNMIK
jgi:phosphatidylinositol glycan class Q protein